MHGWPNLDSSHSLERIRAGCRLEADPTGEGPLPESLVLATARNVMRLDSRPHAELAAMDPRIRWLVQEALKGLAAN